MLFEENVKYDIKNSVSISEMRKWAGIQSSLTYMVWAWNIGEHCKKTINDTTQMGIRAETHALHKRSRVDYLDIHHKE